MPYPAQLLWDTMVLKAQASLPRPALTRLRRRKLNRLLAHALQHSSWHRQRLLQLEATVSDINQLRLTDLPTMSKQDVLEHFDQIVTDPTLTAHNIERFDASMPNLGELYHGKYHIIHSSGTTGKPGYFVYSQADWRRLQAAIVRGALWDLPMGDIISLVASRPRVAYLAATDGRYGGVMGVGSSLNKLGLPFVTLDINQPLNTWLQSLRNFQPTVVIGYPSAITLLALLTEKHHLPLQLARVISCGEPLSANQRQQLQEIFKTPIVNFYGASESIAIGVESDPNDGMILFDDINIVEINKDSVLITPLTNLTMPLIRYRLQDTVELVQTRNTADTDNSTNPSKSRQKQSRCSFARARVLVGRQEDMLWFTDSHGHSDFLHPLAIEGFSIEGLLDYQFRQRGPASVEMIAQARKPEDIEHIREQLEPAMRKILSSKQLDFVDFTLVFDKPIQVDPNTGKRKLVLS